MKSSVGFRVAVICVLLLTWPLAVVGKVSAQTQRDFEFILHDGLSARDVAHLQRALSDSKPAVLAALGLDEMPSVIVQVWLDEAAYQDAMKQTLGMRAPGSRGYVTGNNEVRLLFHKMLSAQREAVHEFVHAATLTLNPDFGNNPRWLWEATAQYLAGEFVDPKTVEQFQGGQCPSLETLNSPFDRGGSIYFSGYLLGEFIVSNWGAALLPQLVSANGDVETIFGITESEFQAGWCDFVRQKYLL